jgi:hypothetical protein
MPGERRKKGPMKALTPFFCTTTLLAGLMALCTASSAVDSNLITEESDKALG